MIRLLTKCSNIIYLGLLYMIFMIALGSMVSKAFFVIFLLPVVLYMIYRLFQCKTIGNIKISYRFLWWGIFSLAMIFMFFFAYSVRVENLSWDWGKVIRSASERVLTGNLVDEAYFARYPNNQIWYCILVVVFKLVKMIVSTAELEQFYLVSVAFGCVLVNLTILLFHHIAKMLWGEKKAFYAGILLLLCFPLYMWAPYAYTDTSGMLCLMILLYLWIKGNQTECLRNQIVCFSLFGIVAAVAFQLKVTVFILAIAACITMLLKGCWKKTVVFLALVVVSFFVGKVVTQQAMCVVIDLDEKMYDENELPLTHWVMMSLKYGGYDQEDVDYTISFPTYEEKKKANIKEIKSRLKQKGVLESAKLFLVNKQIRTWGDATFAGCDYLSRGPKNPDGFFEKFVTQTGSCNWLVLLYVYLYYGLILVGMFIGGFRALKIVKSKDKLQVARITILGIATLMTIWECNSRYIVVFLPLMILLASEGYIKIRKYLCTQDTKGRTE